MEWILHLVAVGALITMLASAFRRGSEAVSRTIGSAAVMVGLAFTPAGWVVHVGMAILLLSTVEFLFRPYFKVRTELLTSLGSLAAVTVAGMLNGAFPWVVFPLGCMVALWYLGGGPARNRRKAARALQRKAFHAASEQQATVQESRTDLDLLFNDPRLPAPSRKQLHAVLHHADRLHVELRAQQASDRLIFEVEQIHQDFAPTAVRGYLALPPSVADSQPIQDGKTGATLLAEQLTLLDGALDDIAAEARTHGAEGLLASYRFLQNKFGGTDDELKL